MTKPKNGSEVTLDRHKMAAILLKAILLSKPLIASKEILKDHIFVGNEYLAIEVALSYLNTEFETLLLMNKVLDEYKEARQKLIDSGEYSDIKNAYILLPKAMSCSTPYLNIVARNFWYTSDSFREIADRDDKFDKDLVRELSVNVLDYSDRFFLLEQISLYKCGIDPKSLQNINFPKNGIYVGE